MTQAPKLPRNGRWVNVKNLSNLDWGSSVTVKGFDVVCVSLGQVAVVWHLRFSLVIVPEASTAPDFFAKLNPA